MSDFEQLQQILKPYLKNKLTDSDWQQMRNGLVRWKRSEAVIDDSPQQLFVRWLEEQVSLDEPIELQLCEPFLSSFPWENTMIPMLVHANAKENQFNLAELQKLIETYFDLPVLLFPLNNQDLLLLLPSRVMTKVAIHTQDSWRRRAELLQIGFGLHAMLEHESQIAVHIIIADLVDPFKQIVNVVKQQRHILSIGLTFAPTDRVIASWQFELEQLLLNVAATEKIPFVEPMFSWIDTLDREMKATLTQFFVNQCSISETAKALHLHRNTLLYRLDKFKLDSGRDVRRFDDAMIVRIALILSSKHTNQ